jgi:hypothetical protein
MILIRYTAKGLFTNCELCPNPLTFETLYFTQGLDYFETKGNNRFSNTEDSDTDAKAENIHTIYCTIQMVELWKVPVI